MFYWRWEQNQEFILVSMEHKINRPAYILGCFFVSAADLPVFSYFIF